MHRPPTAARCKAVSNTRDTRGLKRVVGEVAHLHHVVFAGSKVFELPPRACAHRHRTHLTDAHNVGERQCRFKLREMAGRRHEQRQVTGESQQVLVREERGVGGDHDLGKGVTSDISHVRCFQIGGAVAFNIRTNYIRQGRRGRRLVDDGQGCRRPQARAHG